LQFAGGGRRHSLKTKGPMEEDAVAPADGRGQGMPRKGIMHLGSFESPKIPAAGLDARKKISLERFF